MAGDFNWVVHAYRLMDNHHLLMETPDGNLGKGMRQLNGVHTQHSNRRHRRVGHLTVATMPAAALPLAKR